MTTQALLPLIAFALLKGALFGILFAWMFPPLNRYLLARMGRDAGPLRQVAFGSRLYWGLAVLCGAGFALLDLVDRISEAAGLPGLLFWVVIALFGLTACGTVLIVSAMPRELQPAGQVTGTATGASVTPQA
jgi:Mn2+/Fe2+ NRAMP family transporter